MLRTNADRRPYGFVEPCRPSKADRPPSGPQSVHEVKHDGFRLMVRRDGARVRCFTRNGHDWADRFPAIVEAARTIKVASFLIDGEAVICRHDGVDDKVVYGTANWSAKGKDKDGKPANFSGIAVHVFERQVDGSLKLR